MTCTACRGECSADEAVEAREFEIVGNETVAVLKHTGHAACLVSVPVPFFAAGGGVASATDWKAKAKAEGWRLV